MAGKNGGRDAREAGEAAARKRAEEAQDALRAAQEEAAEASSGLAAAVTRDIPTMLVEVRPGNTISHNNESYYGEGYPLAPDGHKGSDTVELDGPTAIALLQAGYVTIRGAA